MRFIESVYREYFRVLPFALHGISRHQHPSIYTVSIAMAGGAPVPVPTSDPDEKILSIADLEKAASTRLGKTARGKCQVPTMLDFCGAVGIGRPVLCLRLHEDVGNVFLKSIAWRKGPTFCIIDMATRSSASTKETLNFATTACFHSTHDTRIDRSRDFRILQLRLDGPSHYPRELNRLL